MRIINNQLSNMFSSSNEKAIGIVGDSQSGSRLEKTIGSSNRWSDFNLLGYYDDRHSHRSNGTRSTKLKRRGGLTALYEDAKSEKLDVVYITFPLYAEDRINEIITLLADTSITLIADTSVDGRYIPNFLVFPILHSRWVNLHGLPVISIFETPISSFNNRAKRVIDIILSITILAFLLIPMLIIAFGVKLSSPGPIIFKQRRYGIHGEKIKVWKFRTMFVCEDGELVKQATHNDTRITNIGGFLRRKSIDELPQFFNVLQGDMSIVGPRPHAISHNEFYREHIPGYMLRHRVKPGITGLAQINGCRGETETIEKMEERVRYDLEYIRQLSFWLDAKIFVKTILHVLRGEPTEPSRQTERCEPKLVERLPKTLR